jgi:hypothetical protein
MSNGLAGEAMHIHDRAEQLCQKLTHSLEFFLAEAIEVLRNQVQLILESIESSRHSLSGELEINAARVSFILTKIFNINREKLQNEFRKSVDKLKVDINELCFDPEKNMSLKLDEIIDFETLMLNTRKTLNGFDTFCAEFKDKISKNLSRRFTNQMYNSKRKLKLERLTDFSSDTESTRQVKSVSDNKCKYLYASLKNATVNSEYESDKEQVTPVEFKLKKSLSESQLDLMSVIAVRKKKANSVDEDESESELESSSSSKKESLNHTSESSCEYFEISETEYEVNIDLIEFNDKLF